MAKLPITTRRSANLMLHYLADHVSVGHVLPSETKMSVLATCSRTTVRRVLAYFFERGLINGVKRRWLLRKPQPNDFFDASDLHNAVEELQHVLMECIYRRDLPPGTEFTEAELSRAAGVSTIAVREFLIRFSSNGLIEKNPRGGWRMCAFDSRYAEELGEVREMFELKAIERVASLKMEDPVFDRLAELLDLHEVLAAAPEGEGETFPTLDREFHTFLISLLNNRFAEKLNEAVSLVYHYHYQWDRRDEIPRNLTALQEHLAILRPLTKGDVAAALAAMRLHMRSARSTMLNSLRHRR